MNIYFAIALFCWFAGVVIFWISFRDQLPAGARSEVFFAGLAWPIVLIFIGMALSLQKDEE